MLHYAASLGERQHYRGGTGISKVVGPLQIKDDLGMYNGGVGAGGESPQ